MLILLLKGEGKADYESTINDLKEPAPWAVASGHVTGNLSEPQSSTAFDLYRAALPSPLTLTVSPLAALLALSSPLLHLPSSHACIMHSQGRVLSRRLLVVPPPPALPLSPSMLIARATKWTPCLAVSDSIAVVRWRLSID